MKTFKTFIGVPALALLAMISCTKQGTPVSDNDYVALEFTAGSTKTILDGQNVLWQSGDAISIFDGYSNNEFTTANTGSNAVFKGHAHLNTMYYAVYPYSAENAFSGSKFTVEIPLAQSAVADGFAPGSNVSVGKTETSVLDMKNICGYVKFGIRGSNVKSVSINSVGVEKLAGKFEVSYDKKDNPVCTAIEGSDRKVSLVPSESVFTPGDYMFCLAATKLSSGVSLTYKTTDGKVYRKTVSILDAITRCTPVYVGIIEHDAEELTPTLQLDPATKTSVFPGDKSMNIYLNTTCDDVTASVKDGATLTDIHVEKVSESNFLVSFSNSSTDPAVYKNATIVFKATGVADLEVPIRQNGVLTLDLSDEANPYGVPSSADNVERTIVQNGYTFKYSHCKWYKSNNFQFTSDGTNSAYIAFPAISGLTLKVVDYTYIYYNTSTNKLNGYITLYGDSDVRLTDKVNNERVLEEEKVKTRRLVLGKGDLLPQPNTSYQFWAIQAASSLPTGIDLYYE